MRGGRNPWRPQMSRVKGFAVYVSWQIVESSILLQTQITRARFKRNIYIKIKKINHLSVHRDLNENDDISFKTLDARNQFQFVGTRRCAQRCPGHPEQNVFTH
jgi:hypothetical protein